MANNLAGMILKEHANQTHPIAAFRTQANIELMAELTLTPRTRHNPKSPRPCAANEVSPAQRPQVWRNKQLLSNPS